MSDRPETAPQEPSKSLWQRRVPHIAGIYLAGAYTLFEMAQWVVKRYQLPVYYEDMCILGLLSLFPSVIILAWGHGAPGKDHWSPLEKLTVPLNLLVTALLLFLIPKNGPVVATPAPTTAVQTVTKVPTAADAGLAMPAPKQSQRTTILAFAFQDATKHDGDDNAWLQYAIPLALEIDLSQELELALISTLSGGFTEMMRKAAFDDDRKLPLALMRSIAKEAEVDYFLSGTMQPSETGYRAVVDLHDMSTGKIAGNYEASDASLFALADRISSEVREGLGMGGALAPSVPDLPVEELATTHVDAFAALIEGMRASTFDNDLDGALANIALAISKDPTFAYAYYNKAMLLSQHSRWAELPSALDSIRPHQYRLSEQARSVLRVLQLWLVDKKPDLALQALEQRLATTPRDIFALYLSVNLKMSQGDYKAALASLDVIETMETKLSHIAARAQLLLADGREEEALETYEAYVKAAPRDLKGHLGMAQVAHFLGKHQTILDAFNRALAEDPTSPNVHRSLAEQLYAMGRYEESEKHLGSMVKHSKTPQEIAASHDAVADYRFTRGQVTLAMESLQKKWGLLAASNSDLEMLGVRLRDARTMAKAGRTTEVLQTIEEARPAMTAGGDDVGSYEFHVFSAIAYSELGESARASESAKVAEAIGTALSLDMRWKLPVQARIEQDEGRLAKAQALYQEYLKDNPADSQTRRRLAEVELALGNPEQALQELTNALRYSPSQPLAHCLMSQILTGQNRPKEAEKHRASAMTTWIDADEDFAPKKLCVKPISE